MKYTHTLVMVLLLCAKKNWKDGPSFLAFVPNAIHSNKIPLGDTATKNIGRSVPNDTVHYWTLKPFLNPQIETIRTNPENYDDRGVVNALTMNSLCKTGYVELCGIYVVQDSANKTKPYFSETVNRDIYEALKKNEFLEDKVFYKDL